MYLRGIGVQRDYPAARKWLGKAARRGHSHARYLLGLMYFRGVGVGQDYAKARYFFEQAAYISPLFDESKSYCTAFLLTPWKDGVPDALCKLCEMDAKGWGQPADMNEAAKMYAWAKERSEKKARACFMRLGVEQREAIEKILQEAAESRADEAKRA